MNQPENELCGDTIQTLDAWEAEQANDFTDEELEAIGMAYDYLEEKWRIYSHGKSAQLKAKAILEARKA